MNNLSTKELLFSFSPLKRKNIFLIFIFFFSFGLSTEAQTKKHEFSYTIGLVVNHDELGSGYQTFTYGGHVGFNMYSKKVKQLKSELQVSLNLVGRDGSSFLSLNALYGGRYYFVDPAKTTTFFVNTLIGGLYLNESGDDFIENLIGFGYSIGFFMDKDRFLIGVSAESFNNFIFKIGYTF